MLANAVSLEKSPVSVLIADDSIVFRRFLRDILGDSGKITIVGEAKNGIEALDLILKMRPQVILMDMEMPLMDGMTALQHLMIHCPTPTIMFSSLTGEGTFRAFDALKNGAVDFLSKDLLFDENRQDVFNKMFTQKILHAAQMKVHSIEPVFDQMPEEEIAIEPVKGVVFCEECGARNVIATVGEDVALCRICGDGLVLYGGVQRHRRNEFVTVFGGSAESYRSLLNIIPKFESDPGGSVIIVIKAESKHVDTFSEYLDSISPMKVLRAREGMCLEGGFCYVATTNDHLGLQQVSGQQTLCNIKDIAASVGSIDLAMISVAEEYKKHCAGVILAGNDIDGIKGMSSIIGMGGSCLVLNPVECLSSRLSRATIERFSDVEVVNDDAELAMKLAKLYRQAKSSGPIV